MQLISLPYTADPLGALDLLRPLSHAMLLHSADTDHPDARFDVLSAAPRAVLRVDQAGRIEIRQRDGRVEISELEPFAALQRLADSLPTAAMTSEDLPFTGGLMGLLGYDLGFRLQRLNRRLPPDHGFPEALVGLYDWALVLDHQRRRATLVLREGHPLSTPDIHALRTRLAEPSAAPDAAPVTTLQLQAEVDRQAYARAFGRAQALIAAGDCYQVNLAVRFAAPCSTDALALYRALSAAQPAPFGGFMEAPEGAVLSCSPERLLAVTPDAGGGAARLRAQPIKGTCARADDAAADRAAARSLLDSAKDRAENLMIVDLLRHDLGRSAAIGSVTVPELFSVQSFATVHHLVSRIEARLRADLRPLDALRAAFPGGSITGAPKLRAMQVIEEIEQQRRSAYCGALFMLDAGGRLDASITIRTLLLTDARLLCWAGGGIVADSEEASEWRELHDKVRGLVGPAIDQAVKASVAASMRDCSSA